MSRKKCIRRSRLVFLRLDSGYWIYTLGDGSTEFSFFFFLFSSAFAFCVSISSPLIHMLYC